MMENLNQCPINHLQSYLDDSLDPSLHDQLLKHLDQCKECRQRIEKNAGTEDDWLTARKALASCVMDAYGNLVLDGPSGESLGESRTEDPLTLLKMLAPTDEPRAAGRIGPFEITGIIGSGGMGIVLKALDPALDRFVAVKVLAPHLAQSQSARKRFAREARAAAAIIHDNVIAIYQVSEWNELPFLVMPYLPDPSLQQRIDDHGRLDLESTLSIGMQVAKGLAAAHSQGLVHRDVKPGNVLLSMGTERAIITDFGLARAADDPSLTRIGTLAGTPHYMSPEQARGEPVDQKSDLFSLGSLLYAMITGHPPVELELGSETIRQIAKGKLPSLGSSTCEAPIWFVRLVDRLHKPRPNDRPESAAQVAEWLEQCLAHLRQPDLQPIPACLYSDMSVPRMQRLLVCLTIATLLSTSLFAFVLFFGLERMAVNKESTEATPVPTQMEESHPDQLPPSWHEWSRDQLFLDELQSQSRATQVSIEEEWAILPQSILRSTDPTTIPAIER